MHLTVTRLSSVFSLLTQFSGNLQWDTCERNEPCGDKGNILRWQLERSFVRIFSVMCEFISQSYIYVSCSSPLSQFLRNLWRTSLDRIEEYADKGNIISSKRETSFLRNFLLVCHFISQSYTYVSCSSPVSLFLRNLRGLLWIALRPTLIKEISSVPNVKEAFWVTSWCIVNSIHRVTA